MKNIVVTSLKMLALGLSISLLAPTSATVAQTASKETTSFSETTVTTRQQENAAPLKVLTLGDSITHGFAGDYTWRYHAYNALKNTSTPIDFVGTTRTVADSVTLRKSFDYADPNFDQDHGAVGGSKITALPYDVSQVVNTLQPDVVFVSYGTNDIIQGVDYRKVIDAHKSLVEKIRVSKPDAVIILSHLTQPWLKNASLFNSGLDGVAKSMTTSLSPVSTAPVLYKYVYKVDTWDHLHPTRVGEVKIAQAFLVALSRTGLTVPPKPVTKWPAAAGPDRKVVALRAAKNSAVGNINVAWNYPPGITNVRIQYRPIGPGTKFTTLSAPTTATSVTIRKLKAGHNYQVRVIPGRGTAASPLSAASHITAQAGYKKTR